MKFIKQLILLVFMIGSFQAMAGVNLKNGNFYISYTDIVVNGLGKKLEMTRTYNSKSTSVGWFGFGWGNYYETKLVTSADGCVVVHEHGAGGKTRFCPKNSIDPETAANKIIAAMRKSNGLTESSVETFKKRLVNNAELRHAYAKNFGVKTEIASGTKLYSNQRGIQEVTVTKEGYVRSSNDGRVESFNKLGQLVKVQDKNNYFVEFKYDKKQLESIKDSHAKQIYFKWNSSGKVAEMWSQGDKKAEFKYDGQDLVYSKDVTGNEYQFVYDKNHNLTKIVYNPNKKKGEPEDAMKMSYSAKTYYVTEIVDRNGESTKYKYGAADKNPEDHYWTEVTKTGFNGQPVTNKYEYEIKTRPDGSRYTYRIETQINGIKTETIYSECCGLPLKIARGKHVTNFEYNDDGLLVKKSSTKGEFVKIEYDQKLKKISKVINGKDWTEFDYDKKGNLVKAKNNKGKAVLLIYNTKGKITKMVDKEVQKGKSVERMLSFTYNSLGKPEIIKMEKVGQIMVKYDNYGDIKRVESKDGHKMALQVTQAFQNLLAIVKPAGVNLNM
tara:strand:- start:19442 stop:21100 length:1659 start_codon:yes stop_codon:yes gene_type:complete